MVTNDCKETRGSKIQTSPIHLYTPESNLELLFLSQVEGGENLTPSIPHLLSIRDITFRGDLHSPFLPWGSPRSSCFPPLRGFNVFIHLGGSLGLSLPISPTMKHK